MFGLLNDLDLEPLSLVNVQPEIELPENTNVVLICDDVHTLTHLLFC